MSPPLPPRIYSLLRSTARPAAGSRGLVAGMIAAAVAIGALGVSRVAHRHEVVQLGFELSAANEQLHKLQDDNRKLELERSGLADPQRIRALAAALGLVSVPPDAIRIVPGGPVTAAAEPPAPPHQEHR